MQTTRDTLVQLIKLLSQTKDFDALSSKFDLSAETEDGRKFLYLKDYAVVCGQGESWVSALEDMQDSAECALECWDHNATLERLEA